MYHNKDNSLTGFKRAKNYCFRLFKIRPRSEFELRRKLRERKFPQELIEFTIDYFKKLGLVNDFAFARFWISSRIRRPLGMKRLFYELKIKGISKEIFEEVAGEFREFSNEFEVVRELAQSKLKRIKVKDKYKTKAKIYAFLLRRGFSTDTIREVVNTL